MTRRTQAKNSVRQPMAINDYHNNHLCKICGEFGAYGHSEPGARVENIRWYCAKHRPADVKSQQIGRAA